MMAEFPSMKITELGQSLYNKAQAGVAINFTKMKIGSGRLSDGQDQTKLTALIDYKYDIPIGSIKQNVQLQVAMIAGYINNSGITTGTYICELGLFAQDPDIGEILYAYTNADDKGDYYAPASSGPFAWSYQINAAIGNASNVTATLINSSLDYSIESSSTFVYIEGVDQKEINESIDSKLNELNENFDEHLTAKASTTVLGHVRVDGTTIIANENGVISGIDPIEIIKEFVVASSKTVTAGDVVSYINGGLAKTAGVGNVVEKKDGNAFSAHGVENCIAILMDSTHVLVVYSDIYNSTYYGTAIVLTISGTNITNGTVFQFNNTATYYMSATKLNSTHVLVVYGSNAVVLTISGATITAGTAITFTSNSATYKSVVTLDSTHALVAYYDSTAGSCSAVVLTISGTTITIGTIKVVASSTAIYSSCSATLIDSTHVLVAFNRGSDVYGMAIVLTISGVVITTGSIVNFNSDVTNKISLTTLNNTRVIVAYMEDSGLTFMVRVLNVSGTNITSGPSVIIYNNGNSNNRDIVVIKLDSNHVLIVYGAYDTGYGKAAVLTVSDASITIGTVYQFYNSEISYISAVALDTVRVLAVFKLNSSSIGYPVVLTIDNSYVDNILGIAKESKSSGQSCKVSLGPIASGLSGLQPGSNYYVGPYSELNATPKYAKVGFAVSSTELKHEIKYLS